MIELLAINCQDGYEGLNFFEGEPASLKCTANVKYALIGLDSVSLPTY